MSRLEEWSSTSAAFLDEDVCCFGGAGRVKPNIMNDDFGASLSLVQLGQACHAILVLGHFLYGIVDDRDAAVWFWRLLNNQCGFRF